MRAYRARRREVTTDVDTAWRRVRELEHEAERVARELEAVRTRLAAADEENRSLRAELRRVEHELDAALASQTPASQGTPGRTWTNRAERRRQERARQPHPNWDG
jgi:regulator of replication initiation timing